MVLVARDLSHDESIWGCAKRAGSARDRYGRASNWNLRAERGQPTPVGAAHRCSRSPCDAARLRFWLSNNQD